MANVNGEKAGNGSEEEESEDVESEDEERRQRAGGPAAAVQETSGSMNQVGVENLSHLFFKFSRTV